MKGVALLVVAVLCLAAGSGLASVSYLTLRVAHSDGSWTEAVLWPDHLADTSWVQEPDYLDQPQVALDGGGVKYGTLGPDGTSGWTAYVWAGYRMVAGTPYEVSAQAFGPSLIVGQQADGTVLFQEMLAKDESRQWTFYALPATTAQWRTKGYKLVITPAADADVVEPTALFLGGGGILAIAGFCRRRKS